MIVGEMINRDIMLWHDEREKSNFAYLYKHDFMFEKFNPRTTHSYEISFYCYDIKFQMNVSLGKLK